MSALSAVSSGEPTVVSTFAGCGGSSLGYRQAGYRELLAVEWDTHAVGIFKMNFPDVPVYHGDITNLTVDHCLELIRLAPGELDLLDGSPPCQGFSMSGKRELNDRRNTLFEQFCRLLDGLKPKAFVIENVPGLVRGAMRMIYLDMITSLRACGYRVKGEILNAANFGVPQYRERVIVIGIREDHAFVPSHPRPYMNHKSVRMAIGHLENSAPPHRSERQRSAWSLARPGGSLRKVIPHCGSFQIVRLNPLFPSNTQTTSGVHWHYSVPRKLTVQEMSILQGFPEDFRWSGIATKDTKRIGNSVPPPLAAAIGRHLQEELFRYLGPHADHR